MIRVIEIPKRSGGVRTVYAQGRTERKRLAPVAATIAAKVAELSPENVLHGFVAGRSPVTNAHAHRGAQVMLNMDLRDFFDHCTAPRIAAGLLPFAPVEWLPTGAATAARELAESACYLGAARQGLSSSPAAANAAALPLDREILAALPVGVTYTRYADDLTFSADDPALLRGIRGWLPSIAQKYGQEVNARKTRMQCAPASLVVTGVAIASGGALRAPRSVRRRLRAARHNCAQVVRTMMLAPSPAWAAAIWAASRRKFQQLRGLQEWAAMKFPRGYTPQTP